MSTYAEEHYHRHHQRGLLGPFILIGAGILFLLNTSGALSWNVWWSILRLWPVLLIAAGLEILIGRRSLLASLSIGLLVLAIFGAAIVYGVPGSFAPAVYGMPMGSFGPAALHTETISQPLQGATSAGVEIVSGAGDVNIREGLESASLVEGTAALAVNERLATEFRNSGGKAQYRLAVENNGAVVLPLGFDGKAWDLRLSPDVPLDLTVRNGVGSANLDLSHLRISSLHIKNGVGSTILTMPRAGKFDTTIEGGVGGMRVVIPASMAARIRVDGSLAGVEVSGNFQNRGSEYVTPGFENASDRVDLEIHSAIGNIAVEQSRG